MCNLAMTALVCACVLLGSTEGVEPEVSESTCAAIEDQAPKLGFDPVFIAATSWKESRFYANRTGRLGEMGPLQIMPWMAQKFGFSREQLQTHEGGIHAGLAFMKFLRDDYLGGGGRPLEWFECYASGNRCRATRAIRNARIYERQLRLQRAIVMQKFYLVRSGRHELPWSDKQPDPFGDPSAPPFASCSLVEPRKDPVLP